MPPSTCLSTPKLDPSSVGLWVALWCLSTPWWIELLIIVGKPKERPQYDHLSWQLPLLKGLDLGPFHRDQGRGSPLVQRHTSPSSRRGRAPSMAQSHHTDAWGAPPMVSCIPQYCQDKQQRTDRGMAVIPCSSSCKMLHPCWWDWTTRLGIHMFHIVLCPSLACLPANILLAHSLQCLRQLWWFPLHKLTSYYTPFQFLCSVGQNLRECILYGVLLKKVDENNIS